MTTVQVILTIICSTWLAYSFVYFRRAANKFKAL